MKYFFQQKHDLCSVHTDKILHQTLTDCIFMSCSKIINSNIDLLFFKFDVKKRNRACCPREMCVHDYAFGRIIFFIFIDTSNTVISCTVL